MATSGLTCVPCLLRNPVAGELTSSILSTNELRWTIGHQAIVALWTDRHARMHQYSDGPGLGHETTVEAGGRVVSINLDLADKDEDPQ